MPAYCLYPANVPLPMNDSPPLEDQLKQLAQRLEGLERLVQSQIQRIFTLEQQLGRGAARADASSLSSTEIPPPQTKEIVSSTPPPVPQSARTSFPARPSHPVKTAPHESLETVIAGNWLNKIGIVAIILGMAYFLKYAIDNRWIGEMGRVILGVLTGLGLLFGGEALQRKQYRAYGITIAAGGIAILYFSIFAAFNFYALIAQLPALFLMVLITTSAVLMALRYDAKVIAWIGILGGFLTPVMLSTGKDNQVGLFIYIALLDSGVLALAYFKEWRSLNLLAFLLTQLTFLAWSVSFYTEAKLWRTEFFLTLFFFIFAVMSFLYNIVHQKVSRLRDLSLIFLNGGAYFLWTYSLLESKYFDYLGLYAVLMAAIYVALGSIAHHRARQDTLLFLIFLAMGLTCLTLAIPIQLKQNWITIGWAVEAVILTWIGFHLADSKMRLAAFLVASLVAIRLLFHDSNFLSYTTNESFTFLLNKRSFTFIVGVIAIFVMAYLYAQHRESLVGQEPIRIAGLIIAANFLLIFFLTTELAHSFELRYYREKIYQLQRDIHGQQELAISALWAVYSILLVILGIMKKYQPIRLLAIILFGVTILKVFLLDLSDLEKIYRIISFMGLGVILLAVSFMYQKYRNQINEFVLK
jgi:uncharacterized membrane protein